MPLLSIIIVNYNVRYFLEQCLISLKRATVTISTEIIVIDNASNDTSISMIEEKFPEIILLKNTQNVGFSKANNQGLHLAKGKFILILNPDTLMGDETLIGCLQFLEKNLAYGACCVKMVDGSGKYLPESKRGKPTFWASFSKTTGLYKLFPKIKTFNSYYLGHLDQNKETDIEIMTGAFMLLRNNVVERIGGLDERFFMYGEDIDYSYRILESGFLIRYLPQYSIIHFKGESTRRTSLNYLKIFYNAMILFVEKHYKNKSFLLKWILKTSIYFRASFAWLNNWLKKVIPITIDTFIIYSTIFIVSNIWGIYYFKKIDYYQPLFYKINAPIYTIIFIIIAWLSGHYELPIRIGRIFKISFLSFLIILILYSILPVHLRNSRAVIFISSTTVFICFLLTSMLRNLLTVGRIGFFSNAFNRFGIVSSENECKRILNLLNFNQKEINFAGRIDVAHTSKNSLGKLDFLGDIITAYKIKEIIFSQKDVATDSIIAAMVKSQAKVLFRVAPSDSASIISSNSKFEQGNLFTLDFSYSINNEVMVRNKRLFDIIIGLFLLFFYPIIRLIFNKKQTLFKEIIQLIRGKITLISYIKPHNENVLPKIKKGIFDCSMWKNNLYSDDYIANQNLFYAKNYSITMEFEILYKKFINKI